MERDRFRQPPVARAGREDEDAPGAYCAARRAGYRAAGGPEGANRGGGAGGPVCIPVRAQRKQDDEPRNGAPRHKMARLGQGRDVRARLPRHGLHAAQRERPLERRRHRDAARSHGAQQGARGLQQRALSSGADEDDAVVGRRAGQAEGRGRCKIIQAMLS